MQFLLEPLKKTHFGICVCRVLEASLAENKSGLKRKRGDPWVRFVDPVNPYERQRLDGCPVGLKNVGNTCWFSAVIQVCISVPTEMLTTWRLISVIILVHKNSILWCILKDSSVHAFLLQANFPLNKRHTIFQNIYDFLSQMWSMNCTLLVINWDFKDLGNPCKLYSSITEIRTQML